MDQLRRTMQRLFVAIISSMLAFAPLMAHAAATPSLDSLWNEPQGLSMDSALYVLQAWLDGSSNKFSNDPTERGFDELSRANTDLLDAYALLEHAHQAGAQPVPIIDPLFAGAYDGVTGSQVKAPVGELFASINRGLLTLEGRGSIKDQVAGLLEESRAMQAAGIRDLQTRGAGYDNLIASNAQREADFLTQLQGVSTPDDGLTSLLAGAVLQTTTVAHHRSLTALASLRQGNGAGSGHGNGRGNGYGQGQGHGQGQGAGTSNSQANGNGKKK